MYTVYARIIGIIITCNRKKFKEIFENKTRLKVNVKFGKRRFNREITLLNYI